MPIILLNVRLSRIYIYSRIHLFAYRTVVMYIFYHLIFVSLVLGFLLGIYLERMYAASTVKRRMRALPAAIPSVSRINERRDSRRSTSVRALEFALNELKISYRPDSDIVVEIENIINRYEKGGIALSVLFNDFAWRSGLEDIKSFASIYEVIEGKNYRISDILTETSEIIGDKIEIEQEIETTITSAKSETYMMLLMPIIIVLAMSFMGGELLEALFETTRGHLAATASLVLFVLSYILAVRASDINV